MRSARSFSSFWRRADRSSTAGRASSESQRASRRRAASSPRARATSARAASRACVLLGEPGGQVVAALAGARGRGRGGRKARRRRPRRRTCRRRGRGRRGRPGVQTSDGEPAGLARDRLDPEAVGARPCRAGRTGRRSGRARRSPRRAGRRARRPIRAIASAQRACQWSQAAWADAAASSRAGRSALRVSRSSFEPVAGLRFPGDGVDHVLGAVDQVGERSPGSPAGCGGEGLGQLAAVSGDLLLAAGDGLGLLADRAGQGDEVGRLARPGEHLARGAGRGDPQRPPRARTSGPGSRRAAASDRAVPGAEVVERGGQPRRVRPGGGRGRRRAWPRGGGGRRPRRRRGRRRS